MIVEGSMERFELPVGMALTARPLASSAEAYIVSIYGTSFGAVHATYAEPASVGPFTETCTIGVASNGGPTHVEVNGLTAAQSEAVVAALPVTSLWANRAALVTAETYTAFFSDVGIGGSVWTYSGGRWRPYGGRVRLKSLTTDVSNNGSPKVVLDYATLLAGLFQDGDTLECSVIKERTGGTSDTDATDVMLGTVAATPGTTLNLNTSGLATTNISMSLLYKYRRISATSLRSQSVGGVYGFGNSTSANSLVTGLANMDSTETYLQVTSDLTTAGGLVVVAASAIGSAGVMT